MWDLVPHPGFEPKPPSSGALRLSPWTTREVPGLHSFLKMYLLISGCVGLCCCVRASSGCGERGRSSLCAQASHGCGCPCCRAWPLGLWASVVAAPQALVRRLNSVVRGLSCFAAGGIFLDRGLNPCFLNWQVDSIPLNHQGSPSSIPFSGLITFTVWMDHI